jgi:hypothetical protein
MASVHEQTPAVIKRRKRYDIRYKARVIFRYYELVEENGGVNLRGTQAAISREFDIAADKVSKWLKNRYLLVEESKTKNSKKKSVYKTEKAKFKDQEKLLYDAFFIRRQLFGLWVDKYWLCDEFYEILEATKPHKWEKFKYSNGWVWNFCRRWGITEQCRTNKKDIPISIKEPLVRDFHKQILELQKSQSKDPTYGRFSGERMFHWDQSPVEFAQPGKRTLNIKGTPCWMWQPGSGIDKRFITLQLCIRPFGLQIIKPILIFRGMGVGISEAEREEFEKLTNIRCYFQTKAWADGEFCLWCLDSFKADLLEAGIHEEVLLGLDGLAAQKTTGFLEKAVDHDVLPVYTPPDCTNVIAPCDHHVFLRLKELLKAFYRQISQTQRAVWADCKNNDSLSQSNKRIQIAQWVSVAWTDMCTNHEKLFTNAFTSTGFLMKLADPGADIKIKGLDNYPGPGSSPF